MPELVKGDGRDHYPALHEALRVCTLAKPQATVDLLGITIRRCARTPRGERGCLFVRARAQTLCGNACMCVRHVRMAVTAGMRRCERQRECVL